MDNKKLQPPPLPQRRSPQTWRTVLILKTETDVRFDKVGLVRCRLRPEDKRAVAAAFTRHTPFWVGRLTRGRLRWEAAVVSSPRPLRTVSPMGDQCWVGPSDVRDDIAAYAPPGKYDNIFVYWKGVDDERPENVLPGGFGWSIGPSADANGAGYSCVHYAQPGLWQRDSVTTEIFLHEWLHQIEGFCQSKNLPLPKDGLHGAEHYGFRGDPGWKDWYRAFLNAELDAGDGTKAGLGEKVWALGTIREYALKGK